ncbi:MAG: 23S rRNA (guanosine(2251)-2'-O)-methyltransferase RlmB [Hyphomicrobiaceae bacterium]|nr:23S rRNA (guanosine(2251)-2'-O)-methyltransferase RlmB [Hyphomicrobiaceae bacterium]
MARPFTKNKKPNRADRTDKAKFGKAKPGKAKSSPSRSHDWLYGRHAVLAALANPERQVLEIMATNNATKDFGDLIEKSNLPLTTSTTGEISAQLPPGAVHQGIAIKILPLKDVGLADLALDRPVLVLDQVTDPHNVGAMMRSAAVFNASTIIMTRRNSPPLSGVLAKSACGALEHVDVVFVGNLSQALKELGKIGFWRIGLDGQAENALETSIGETRSNQPIALVLGAEDKGMRRLTTEQCDELCHITTTGTLASLNVSNAAAIALHVIAKPRP